MNTQKYKFKATLIKDTPAFKRGEVIYPKGFYYQGNQIILVGDIKEDHTIRLALHVESVKMEVKNIDEDTWRKTYL